ncbi:MAG: type III pantothenate kinase [Thermoanaerobaculia bacterium]
MADERASGQVLLIDAGNTNTVFGICRGEDIESLRLSTEPGRTADEHGALLLPLLERLDIDAGATEAVLVASVVPPLNPTLELLSRRYFGVVAGFVGPGIRTGLEIRYDHPAEVGADRIVNAVAARELHGSPVVVVDFGTATTFDVVDRDGAYAGGIIAPGVSISAEALFARASRLYRVDVKKPPQLVGRNTAGAVQSGIYYGYIGMVDGILRRLVDHLPGLRRVVATGGQASLIAADSEYIDEVNDDLTLLGLRRIHELNQKP